jgi:uncharacterized protein
MIPTVTEEAFVEVTGHGSALTVPDRLRVWLAAVAESSAVADAFEAADGALQAMLAALRDQGVADEDLRTTQIDVEPEGRGRGKAARFSAHMGIEVVLRDIAAAGRVLTAAIDAGGNASRVNGVSLTTTSAEEALAGAREAAWADALSKARQYARLADRDIGAVLQVSERSGGAGTDGHAEPLAAAAAFSRVVEPGSQTVHAVVTVRWQLR